MRTQRAGQATFIPLDTIQLKPINDKFRSFTKGARLAVDVIQYDPAVERAIHHACGNALICDTSDIAMSVCVDKGQDVKGMSYDVVRADVPEVTCMFPSRHPGGHYHPQERSDHWWTKFSSKWEEVGGEGRARYANHEPKLRHFHVSYAIS